MSDVIPAFPARPRTRPRLRTGVRVGSTALALATFTVLGGAAAQAHVRVIPESTAGGGFTKLTFRVPSESDTASTTSVAVTLPTDTPLAFVSARPQEGWTVKVTKTKLAKPVEVEGTTITEAPSLVTWTAVKGHELGPGQFQEFAISGGPLPTTVKSISFPAVQTYSDGTVANWNEPQAEGAKEPEHPVPSFEITEAEDDEHGDDDTTATAASTTSEDESDDTARGLGIGGLVAGLLGLILGLLAWRKAGSGTAGKGTAGSGTAGSGAAGPGTPGSSGSAGNAGAGAGSKP
jgi:periplasmic copper chaperone A